MTNILQEVTNFLINHILPHSENTQTHIYLVGSKGRKNSVDIDLMIVGTLTEFQSMQNAINVNIHLWTGPHLDLHFLSIVEWKQKKFQSFNSYFYSVLLREQGLLINGQSLELILPSHIEKRIFHYKYYLECLKIFTNIESSLKNIHMMPAFWCYGQIYRQNLEVVMPAGKEGVFNHFMNLDIPIPGLKDYVNMMRWRRALFRTRPAIFYSQTNKIMHFNQLSHLDDSKVLYILNYIKDSEVT